LSYTLPETNIAPENGWLEDESSFLEGIYWILYTGAGNYSRWEIESIGAAQFGAYPPHNLSQLRYPLRTLEDEFWACHGCDMG